MAGRIEAVQVPDAAIIAEEDQVSGILGERLTHIADIRQLLYHLCTGITLVKVEAEAVGQYARRRCRQGIAQAV